MVSTRLYVRRARRVRPPARGLLLCASFLALRDARLDRETDVCCRLLKLSEGQEFVDAAFVPRFAEAMVEARRTSFRRARDPQRFGQVM
jgi:hypothetical protein